MTPLDFIPKSLLLIMVAALAVVALRLHFDKRSLELDVELRTAQVARLESAITLANAEAELKSALLNKKLTEAKNAAEKRNADLLAEKRSLDTALGSLRDATGQARSAFRLSGPATTASFGATDTVLDLLDRCADRYSSLAAKADGHVSDIQTLIQSWPTN